MDNLPSSSPEKSIAHCLVFDPIAFSGGSKVATNEALSICSGHKSQFTVLTASPKCWMKGALVQEHDISIVRLYMPNTLAAASYGAIFWIKQLYLSIYLMAILIKVKLFHSHPISKVIGCSGPGIDMCLYLSRLLFSYKIIQLIHGPVAASRSIGLCLTQCDALFYLASTKPSLIKALSCYLSINNSDEYSTTLAEYYLQSHHAKIFVNGISQTSWPTRSQNTHANLFWAASLLKWKGLDVFIDALTFEPYRVVPTFQVTICYIRPIGINLDTIQAPTPMQQVQWYEQPANLDDLRAQHSIFISTSICEPFGLSILEALAAGMCIVIPEDGAYWDQELTHGLNCMKYTPQDPDSLQTVLKILVSAPEWRLKIQRRSLQLAQKYQAEYCYEGIAQYIDTDQFYHHENCAEISIGDTEIRGSL